MACLWKQSWPYWRNPQYSAVGLLSTTVIALMFGTMFWQLGKGPKHGKICSTQWAPCTRLSYFLASKTHQLCNQLWPWKELYSTEKELLACTRHCLTLFLRSCDKWCGSLCHDRTRLDCWQILLVSVLHVGHSTELHFLRHDDCGRDTTLPHYHITTLLLHSPQSGTSFQDSSSLEPQVLYQIASSCFSCFHYTY